MSKTVLVITGSLRRGGNSDQLAEALGKGTREAGHRVEKFETAFRRIAGCTACEQCWSKGRACVIEDDWQELSEKMEAADVLVFAYPLYWSTMPAQMKGAVDRLFSCCAADCARPLTGKEYVALLCGECEGDGIFREARAVHKGLEGYFAWRQVGEVAVHSVFEKGAILKTGALDRAYRLGLSL